MSWDFSMEYPPEPRACPKCGGSGEIVEQDSHERANYTYNVWPMFCDTFPGDEGIRQLDGLIGEECRDLLKIAIGRMEEDPDKYRAMNPKNGWGDYESALELLRTLNEWCYDHPRAKMRVE